MDTRMRSSVDALEQATRSFVDVVAALRDVPPADLVAELRAVCARHLAELRATEPAPSRR